MPGENGQPLPEDVRKKMESSFGTDFSDVRVHTDGSASGLNKDLSARAFTHGNDIYFRQGQYSPSTQHGQQLIAHELTHVVQQKAGRVKTTNANGAQAPASLGAQAKLNGHLAAGGMKATLHGIETPQTPKM